MISHLSTEQISKLLIGEGTPEEEKHAGECAECLVELTRLRETLSAFRDSVQDWAGRSGRSVLVRSFPRSESTGFGMHRFRWALAAAALIVLVAIPLYRNLMNRHLEKQAVEDMLLLEQVNAHLSRAVPAPMEPLMEMLSDTSVDKVGGRQ